MWPKFTAYLELQDGSMPEGVFIINAKDIEAAVAMANHLADRLGLSVCLVEQND